MTQKTAYQYETAGLYVGQTGADESPLEPGVYLLPAGCTLTAPPAATAGKVPRWNGRGWQMVTRPKQPDPLDKLRDFLAANPDVAAALKQGGV
jgi:hypothetical protein